MYFFNYEVNCRDVSLKMPENHLGTMNVCTSLAIHWTVVSATRKCELTRPADRPALLSLELCGSLLYMHYKCSPLGVYLRVWIHVCVHIHFSHMHVFPKTDWANFYFLNP